MIPKIIHFCWFGSNPYPDVVIECMKSWKKMCPDYKIMCWNEYNFDVNQNLYVQGAYSEKKWAFVSDYARVKVLYEHGGVYLDTDVELIKPIDELLYNKAFMGFEHGGGVNSGLIAGSEAGMSFFKDLLCKYDEMNFYNMDGTPNLTSCVKYTTDMLVEKGLEIKDKKQIIDQVTIYPVEFFCPQNQYTGKIEITNNTFSVHRYLGSWATGTIKYRNELRNHMLNTYGKVLGYPCFAIKYSLYVIKNEGIRRLVYKIFRRIFASMGILGRFK